MSRDWRQGCVLAAAIVMVTPGVMPAARAGSARDAGARGLPERLVDTGLFAADGRTIRDGLIAFSPQYPLWSDGATKRRWLYLPPDTFIDARNADAWDFPRGTKLWKEFRHGDAIETRYIERGMDGSWRYGSYVWNSARTDALLAPSQGLRDLPVASAPQGRYSIPGENDCRGCHEGAPVPVLGFSALQLSSDRDPRSPHAENSAGADLQMLVARGLLRNLPAQFLSTPPRIDAASPEERASLGYLHGNCGHCHNDDGPLAIFEMNLSLRAAANFSADSVRRRLLGEASQLPVAGMSAGSPRIAPGHAAASVLTRRMISRDPRQQMPPLGSVLPDSEALALLGAWVDGLSNPVAQPAHATVR